jgi:hypothetical protein
MWYRQLLIASLALALTVGTSCTSGDLPSETQLENDGPPGGGGSEPPGGGETEPPGGGSEPPGETEPPGGETVPPEDGKLPPNVNLLVCDPQPYASATAVIGPLGGQISVGNHNLTILENALSEDVAITAEQIEGQIASVRFSPEGLQFAVPTVLTLSYQNCVSIPDSKRIVYISESLQILQSLPSVDVDSTSQVSTLLDHFSRYAVAY